MNATVPALSCELCGRAVTRFSLRCYSCNAPTAEGQREARRQLYLAGKLPIEGLYPPVQHAPTCARDFDAPCTCGAEQRQETT